ncbi:lysophospholipid acyltransferase family protein [Salinarimonas rosea]|uniref:lysophospholipid acyltransferase family protein n=1 Tax=Salinarimonas rosea TaxID=552063 RepID=UPI0003FE3AEC|nr:lysophospholipid acyltransferase family protein [Salinarimonas rosea]
MTPTSAFPPALPASRLSPRRLAVAARSRAFDLYLALWTGLFGLAIPIFALLGSPRPAIRAATRVWVRGAFLGLRAIVGLGHVERGRENVPAGPCLVVANHQSTWETFAALVLFPDVAIVAKQELLQIPVFGWYLRRSGMIVIDRASGGKALREMIEQSRATLAEGRSVLIFPEGTRRAPSDPIVFKRGAELLYKALGVPALPMAVDSGLYWRSRSPRRAGTIRVTYAAPIAPGLSASAFAETAEAALEAARRA